MDRERTSKRKSIADEPPRSEHRDNRRGDGRSDETASVRLIRKYAEMIDGVSLEDAEVGDRLGVQVIRRAVEESPTVAAWRAGLQGPDLPSRPPRARLRLAAVAALIGPQEE